MKLPLFFNKTEVVTTVATFGFFQTFLDYANPLIQFLIAICTLAYVNHKRINEKNKKDN